MITDLLLAKNSSEIERVFRISESLFVQGDEATQDLIAFGLLEDLQTTLCDRPQERIAMTALLPPTLKEVWFQVERHWGRCKSLCEVIEKERAESKGGEQESSSWAQFLTKLREPSGPL